MRPREDDGATEAATLEDDKEEEESGGRTEKEDRIDGDNGNILALEFPFFQPTR